MRKKERHIPANKMESFTSLNVVKILAVDPANCSPTETTDNWPVEPRPKFAKICGTLDAVLRPIAASVRVDRDDDGIRSGLLRA
jgi:hypothetical protein